MSAEQLMQRDEDTLVQQRLHADKLRRGSTIVEASVDERKDPDIVMDGRGLLSGSRTKTSRDEGVREFKRSRTEVAERSGVHLQLGLKNPWRRRQMMPKRDEA